MWRIVALWVCLVGLVSTMPLDPTKMAKLEHIDNELGRVARQLMVQQFYVEETARSTGNSGIKRMRGMHASTSYGDSETISAMHDHPTYERTMGLGEVIAVLNGVEFRTRHNDYPLKMRRKTCGSLTDVPFPDVPREVTDLPDVDAQIGEMKEWFRAWNDQDYSTRDYRPHFKPVMCVLEGAWTHSDQTSIDEPFKSERNYLDAENWLQLAKKVRDA